MDKNSKMFDKSQIFTIIKGCLVAVSVSLVGILFFAFIIKIFGLTDGWIKPINQIIKAASILIGVFVALKKEKTQGLLKGAIIGLAYTLLAFVVFSILNGSFALDGALIVDILFGAIMGAICGVVFVNLKSKKLQKN